MSVRCFLIGRGRAVPLPGRAPTAPSGTLGLVTSVAAVTGCAVPSSNSRFFPLTAGVVAHCGGALDGMAERGVALVGVDVVPDRCEVGGGIATAGMRGFWGKEPGGCWAEGVVVVGGAGCGGGTTPGVVGIAPGTTP